MPGADTHHPEQRWPVELYGGFARRMQDAGYDIVIIGALGESSLAHAIQRQAPRARDLTGRTDLVQIAALGARAALAVGNDLGALHLIAAAGAPTIVLFSSDVDAAAVGAARTCDRSARRDPESTAGGERCVRRAHSCADPGLIAPGALVIFQPGAAILLAGLF